MANQMYNTCKFCYFTHNCNSPDRNPVNCIGFQLRPEYVEAARHRIFRPERANKFYEYFWNNMKIYLDTNGRYNFYDDPVVYFSIDQEKFIKHSLKRNKPIGNWIRINMNVSRYLLFREKFGKLNPKESIRPNGRFIDGTIPVKDDLFLAYEQFVKDTFFTFWNENVIDPSLNTRTKALF